MFKKFFEMNKKTKEDKVMDYSGELTEEEIDELTTIKPSINPTEMDKLVETIKSNENILKDPSLLSSQKEAIIKENELLESQLDSLAKENKNHYNER